MRTLLERGLAARPENAALHAKLGYLCFDCKQFAAAAVCFERALALNADAAEVRGPLARCYVHLHRYAETLDLLESTNEPIADRGRAFLAIGDAHAAEREFRAVLAKDPDDILALRFLGRLLRDAGRDPEILSLCEKLSACGAANAQLLYLWGRTLALASEDNRARRLLFDPDLVTCLGLALPKGFSSHDEFNDALAEEILNNPNRISEFPVEDEANRGSQRVDDLFSGAQPEIIRILLDAVQQAVDHYEPPLHDGFDPWPSARPQLARIRAWGLIQRNTDYEEAHIHPGGWLSGVYYVRVPRAVAEGTGPGFIEFGPPSAVRRAKPGLALPKGYRPREGMLLLAPSHYQHRTIPSGLEEYRISVAFDVVGVNGNPNGMRPTSKP
jgi:tetratricopeptide (TPR) repeat protein